MNIAPKFIVFTKNKERFLEEYENENNTFFKYGGIATKFKEIQEFLLKENFKPKNMRMEEEIQLTFDYIDTKEKLILPLIKLLYEYYNGKDKVKKKIFYLFYQQLNLYKIFPRKFCQNILQDYTPLNQIFMGI